MCCKRGNRLRGASGLTMMLTTLEISEVQILDRRRQPPCFEQDMSESAIWKRGSDCTIRKQSTKQESLFDYISIVRAVNLSILGEAVSSISNRSGSNKEVGISRLLMAQTQSQGKKHTLLNVKILRRIRQCLLA